MASVRSVIAGVLRIPVDRLEAGHGVGTLDGWDSLRHMEVIVQLEDALGVRFDGDEIAEMTTIEGIERVVTSRGHGTS